LLGKEACEKIEVVAMDQHDPYRASTKEHCINATVVWDKFHVLKSFEEALNETRKDLHSNLTNGTDLKMNTAGKFRFIFLKLAKKRDEDEQLHINRIVARNKDFLRLEVIKERMLTLFYEKTAEDAYKVLQEIGVLINECKFKLLNNWYQHLFNEWDTLKNYFQYRVTSALSEGINNVIKVLKRRAYGFRNMEYFKLKILQVCGYLNSRFIKDSIDFTSIRNQVIAQI
jgi:transposase